MEKVLVKKKKNQDIIKLMDISVALYFTVCELTCTYSVPT